MRHHHRPPKPLTAAPLTTAAQAKPNHLSPDSVHPTPARFASALLALPTCELHKRCPVHRAATQICVPLAEPPQFIQAQPDPARVNPTRSIHSPASLARHRSARLSQPARFTLDPAPFTRPSSCEPNSPIPHSAIANTRAPSTPRQLTSPPKPIRQIRYARQRAPSCHRPNSRPPQQPLHATILTGLTQATPRCDAAKQPAKRAAPQPRSRQANPPKINRQRPVPAPPPSAVRETAAQATRSSVRCRWSARAPAATAPRSCRAARRTPR